MIEAAEKKNKTKQKQTDELRCEFVWFKVMEEHAGGHIHRQFKPTVTLTWEERAGSSLPLLTFLESLLCFVCSDSHTPTASHLRPSYYHPHLTSHKNEVLGKLYLPRVPVYNGV